MYELILLADFIVLRLLSNQDPIVYQKTALLDDFYAGKIIFVVNGKQFNYKITDLQNANGQKYTADSLKTVLDQYRNTPSLQTPTKALQIIADDINFKNQAVPLAMMTAESIPTNDIAKIFVLKATRKKAGSEANVCKIVSFGVSNESTSDTSILMLIKNPQYVGGGGLTYIDRGLLEEATDLDKQIEIGTGEVLFSTGVSVVGNMKVNLTMEVGAEYVLAIKPLTNNQENTGLINHLNL